MNIKVGREDLGQRPHYLCLLNKHSDWAETESEVVAAAMSLQKGSNVLFYCEDKNGEFPNEIIDTISSSEFSGPAFYNGSPVAEKLIRNRLETAIKKHGGVFIFVEEAA